MKIKASDGSEMELMEYALVEIHNRLGDIESLLSIIASSYKPSTMTKQFLIDHTPKIEINGKTLNTTNSLSNML